MHDLVINDATCSGCGYEWEECECPVLDFNEESDDDRDDFLPLPGPAVVENKDDDFMHRMFDFEEQERKANEENLTRIGLANNSDLLIPPPVTAILVNERQAELATMNRQPRSPAGEQHSPDGLTYPML